MRRLNKSLILILMFTTFVFFMPHSIHADDAVNPSPSITKHAPVGQTSPEKSESKGISWWWWALGLLLVGGGAAAAAGGGGGGGGGGTHPTTGSATVTW